MSNEYMQEIEINGIKMEIDMRYAKRTDIYKIGSPVKLLVKNGSYEPDVKSGVIVGFEPFAGLPTICVAYINKEYSGAEIKTAFINEKSSDKYEMVMSIDDELPMSKSEVIEKMDRKITAKEEELRDLKNNKKYFLDKFGCYFKDKLFDAETV